MIRYSSKEITFTTEQGNTYTANKLSPFNISCECFKIGKIMGTAIGAAGDAYSSRNEWDEGLGMTLTALTNMVHDNFEDEHFADLQGKMFGSLKFGGNKITDVHFEDDQFMADFLEVWWWLFKENIVNFTLSSGILRSKIQPLMDQLSPKMNEEIKKLLNELKLNTNEQ
ncbi:MAG: hypothetical protein GY861_08000 [bacterium]|nr:hypothetical protein [bacterium]